jgi:hypothetical protein
VSTTDLQPYSPKAVYYEASDSLEYVRRDDPAVYRRIDEYLTLVLDLRSRSLLGFKLKGFRYLYLTRLAPKYHLNDHHFLSLMTILEDAMSVGANGIFEEAERQIAYRDALKLAEQDDVRVDQFPKRAAH